MLFSRLLQLPIPLGVDLRLTPGEHVLRDVANRAVRADVVVMLDVALHQTPCIVQGKWRSRPDALSFERFVAAFDLSFGVSLRLHLNVTLENDDFASLIRTIPGTDGSLNLSRTSRLGVRNESSSRTKPSDC